MELLNILSTYTDPIIKFLGGTYDVSLNWLGNLIRLLIEGIGIVGVGIIAFSVILKLVVLPFDVYQRISMSKQNLKMKENKEKMEKLQKQYANDKTLYNQKLMEMYKANGISMFSSCLPAIISIIVFFVAINAFNAFSQYANLQNYNLMVNSYNEYLTPYCVGYELDGDTGNYKIDLNENLITVQEVQSEEGNYRILIVKDDAKADKYIYYTLVYADNYAEDDYKYIAEAQKTYYVDTEKLYAAHKTEIDSLIEESKTEDGSQWKVEEAAERYLTFGAQDSVVDTYNSEVKERMSFLWIKNIWETDATFKHPVLTYKDFRSSIQNSEFNVNGKEVKFSGMGNHTNVYNNQDIYETVTGKLTAQQKEFNGYYILILLSIGTILLQQFVTMRMQKEQTKYSSVDGQGAGQQKMMMVMMTVMFAIFSFMYSAAFSIYMVTSNILSLITTVVINKLVDISLTKKAEKEMQQHYNNRFPGRTYRSEKTDKTDKKKKTDKANKNKSDKK